jgi:hypothetical protein
MRLARVRWSGAFELKRWAVKRIDFDQIVLQAIQDRWRLKLLRLQT